MLGMDGIVRELIEAGAEVTARDQTDKTCAHWASEHGRVEVLRCLERTCGREGLIDLLMTKDASGSTCAHCASMGGHVEVLRYLWETCGERMVKESSSRGTCVHTASIARHVDALRYMAE
eukprot:767561-Hanusia_phi.AAC.12